MGGLDIPVFEITYDNDLSVYREGDQVEGFVRIVNTEEVKYKVIRVEVCGVAVVRWSKAESKTDSSEKDTDDYSGDCNKEVYFHKKIPLSSKDGSFLEKDPMLETGEHIFSFECKLPQELPSSFEGQYGQIRYFSKVVLERPWKSNVVTKKAFTVLSGLDLNFIPEAASKIELCKFKSLDGCCTSVGTITIDWNVDRSGFVPGEDIYVQGAIQNESKTCVSFSRAILYMTIDYKAGKRKRREYRKLNAVDKGETGSDEVTLWQELIHIPPVPPTGLSRCNLIDINYELHFTAAIEGKKNPIRYIKDIYIGTVPMCRKEMKSCIAGMFNQPYKESVEGLDELHRTNASQLSLTHIVAVASAIEPKANPTAPSFAHMDTMKPGTSSAGAVVVTQPAGSGIDVVEERPPPFAPGISCEEEGDERQPLNPSCPTTRTLLRPHQDSLDGILPSFEASEWGPVSIREQADDAESLRGEFTFAPVYTYYNTMKRSQSS